MIALSPIVALLALAGAPPAPGGTLGVPTVPGLPGVDQVQAARDYDNPPPGASAPDKALWRQAYEANNAIPLAYNRGTRLQHTANTSGYEERLAVLSARGPAETSRAEALRAQLQAAWARDAEVMLEQWPVDKTRVCRYPLLTFEGVLYHDEGPRKAAQLASSRLDLQECVARAEATIRYATKANDDLQRAIAELDRALADIPVGAPAVVAKESSAPAAPDATCQGTLSGAVKGSFSCDVTLITREDGIPVLTITPTKSIDGVPSYVPGSFELPAPPRAGTYTLAALGLGRAVVAAGNGTLYTATRTTSQRGEVTLTLSSVAAAKAGAWTVHGSYRARLLPSASAKTDDVIVEARF